MYDVAVFVERKVLVYKQYLLWYGSLPPLDLYQKPLHYGQLYDEMF